MRRVVGTRGLRAWPDVGLAALGALVLLVAAVPVEAARVADAEIAVFRAVNATDGPPFALVWPVMQLGSLLAVPVTALVAAALRRWELAAGLLLAGGTTYLAARAVKDLVVRARPDRLLTDVVQRGDPAQGSGFVSGHAAVATALLVVAWPRLGRRGRVAAALLAVGVCLSRVHVGAHLPLDVVGGAGLGLAIGALARLALSRRG